jgi:hypothetical protein
MLAPANQGSGGKVTNTEKTIRALEAEWQIPDGFLGGLREGVFDRTGFLRLEEVLRSAEVDNQGPLDRRFVALTWYIPTFMSWQRERVQRRGGSVDELEMAITKIQNRLEELLGVP